MRTIKLIAGICLIFTLTSYGQSPATDSISQKEVGKLKLLEALLRGIFDPYIILTVLAYPAAELRGMRERDSNLKPNLRRKKSDTGT